MPPGLKLWVDIGDRDPWYANVVPFHKLLNELSIPHEWRVSPGDHDGAYWSAHVESYLRFYAAALFSLSSSMHLKLLDGSSITA